MKNILTLLFLAFIFLTKSQIMLKLEGDSLQLYAYSGGDEFNDSALNEKEWKNGLGGRRVLMTQDLAFSPKNTVFENGLICFKAIKEDSIYVLYDWEIDSAYLKKNKTTLIDNKFTSKYSAGGIVSKNKYHYGYYEIRFKVEEGRGVWPAFWFYGGNKNEEIDVFELKCEKNNYLHVDTHCPYGCNKGYKTNLGLNTNWGGWMPLSHYLHEGFNIMALEWKKEELIWYLNGHPLAYFKGSFPNPMKLFLNTSVAKDGEAFKPGPDESTPWPNSYYLDYFRMWHKQKPENEIALKSNDELTYSTKFTSDYSNAPKKKKGLMYRKKNLQPLEGSITLILDKKKVLHLTVLGNCKDESLSITLKANKTNITLTDFQKEVFVPLLDEDRSLELLIKTEKRQYSQKLILR